MGHGAGGKLSSELVEHLFLPAFRNPTLESLGDAAVVDVGDSRLAYTTDSFVVRPLFFPGGNIGHLLSTVPSTTWRWAVRSHCF